MSNRHSGGNNNHGGSVVVSIGVMFVVLLRALNGCADVVRPLTQLSRIGSKVDDIALVTQLGSKADDIVLIPQLSSKVDDIALITQLGSTSDNTSVIPQVVSKIDDTPAKVALTGEASASDDVTLQIFPDEEAKAAEETAHTTVNTNDKLDIFDPLLEIAKKVNATSAENTVKNLALMDQYVASKASKWTSLDDIAEKISKYPLTSKTYAESSSGYNVIAIVPTEDKTFHNIFNAEMSVSAKLEMNKYVQLFNKLDQSEALSSAQISEKEFLSLITKRANSNSVIIVGHSEQINAEKFLILPDGTPISIDVIHKTCLDLGSQCLVLTCYSDDFLINGAVNLSDAYYMTRRGVDMAKLLKSRSFIIPDHVLRALDSGAVTETELMIAAMRSERILRQAAKVTMTGVLAVGGVGTYKIVSTYQSK